MGRHCIAFRSDEMKSFEKNDAQTAPFNLQPRVVNEDAMTPELRMIIRAILVTAMLLVLLPAEAQPGNSQQALSQHIADLQKTPNDHALREKIIRQVRMMKRAPAVPEEARRYFIEGNALLKAARDQKGYELAADAYRRCLLMAPWWGEANYNHAVALEHANQFDEAVEALKLYIASNPGEEESRKAQDKIYEIGAKKIIVAREREEASPKAVTLERNKLDDLLDKIDGRTYSYRDDEGNMHRLEVRGRTLVWMVPGSPTLEWGRFEIRGREFTAPSPLRPDQEFTFIISEDGTRITRRATRYSDGMKSDNVFFWLR
jgi:tetratricopeptide (TPR) repeat protein